MSFRKSSSTILLGVLLAVGSTAVAAQSSTTDQQVTAMLEARKKSAHEVKWIMSQLSVSEKDQLIRQQAIIDDIVQVNPDPANLTPDQRQRLWNATKVIDSILAQDKQVADEQLICRQERKIGSQLAKRNCRTKAQIERDRETAQRELEANQRVQNRP
jgi:hypothetical protein